jgi:hypothetical protein
MEEAMSLEAIRERYGVPARKGVLVRVWDEDGPQKALPIARGIRWNEEGLYLILKGSALKEDPRHRKEYLDPKTRLRLWPITQEEIYIAALEDKVGELAPACPEAAQQKKREWDPEAEQEKVTKVLRARGRRLRSCLQRSGVYLDAFSAEERNETVLGVQLMMEARAEEAWKRMIAELEEDHIAVEVSQGGEMVTIVRDPTESYCCRAERPVRRVTQVAALRNACIDMHESLASQIEISSQDMQTLMRAIITSQDES